MSTSKLTLTKGTSLFTYTEGEGKYFHLQWATMSSRIYPTLSGAFKTAADMILDEHLSAKGPEHNDALLFPVLCLYRHYIELALKEWIILGIRCDFFDDATSNQMLDDKKGILGKHDLLNLWEKAKAFLEHRYPTEAQISVAEVFIRQIHDIDPTGQTLRYDRKKGTWELSKFERFPAVIGVANLRLRMNELFSFLDSCYGHTLDSWQIGQDAIERAGE